MCIFATIMNTKLKIVHYEAESLFRAIEDGNVVGHIEYEVDGQTMTITHTYAYIEGRGIGRKLADAAIGYARSHNMKIIPQCSYVKVLMARVEEYRDMIY